MNTLQNIKAKIGANMTELKTQFGIKEMALFGSYVRNEQKEQSDLDILVDFEESPTMFEFIRVENKLSKILGVKVDLVMKNALKPHIAKQVMQELVVL